MVVTQKDISEMYGEQVVRELDKAIKYIESEKYPYFFDVEKGLAIDTVCIVTKSLVWFYQVSTDRQKIFSDSPQVYSHHSCQKALRLMQEVEDLEA